MKHNDLGARRRHARTPSVTHSSERATTTAGGDNRPRRTFPSVSSPRSPPKDDNGDGSSPDQDPTWNEHEKWISVGHSAEMCLDPLGAICIRVVNNCDLSLDFLCVNRSTSVSRRYRIPPLVGVLLLFRQNHTESTAHLYRFSCLYPVSDKQKQNKHKGQGPTPIQMQDSSTESHGVTIRFRDIEDPTRYCLLEDLQWDAQHTAMGATDSMVRDNRIRTSPIALSSQCATELASMPHPTTVSRFLSSIQTWRRLFPLHFRALSILAIVFAILLSLLSIFATLAFIRFGPNLGLGSTTSTPCALVPDHIHPAQTTPLVSPTSSTPSSSWAPNITHAMAILTTNSSIADPATTT